MKIFIDIGHPAHVHYFRNFINLMQEKRHDFFITARNKEVAQSLLTNYKIQYKSRGKGNKSLVGKLMYIVQGDHVLYKYAKKYHPDVFLSFGSPYAAQVSKLLGKHHIAFYDTENAVLEHTMYAPFTNTILTPSCFFKNFGSKQIFFNGYMELCYLHPKWFTPDPSSLKYINVKKDEKYIIFRYVSWNASHDFMKNGLCLDMKKKLIKELSKYGKILISSEEELPDDLKKYKINIPPERMHDVLHYATLFIGEGATMASECAMIGTPAIYINPITSGTIKEQEKYGLLFEFKNADGVLEKAVELLSTPNLRKEWQKRRQEMLQNKIDVTAFMVWFVENYPESKKIMKEFPDYQNEFKINRKSRIYGNKINSRRKLFLNSNLVTNSEIISKGHLFEVENAVSVGSGIGSGNFIINNSNNVNINSDLISSNLFNGNDNYLPLNYSDLPDYFDPEDKLILPKSDPPNHVPPKNDPQNQFLLKRIYNIFFKLLDDDIRLLNISNIDPAITLFILKYVNEVDSSVILDTNARTHINNLQDSIESIVNIQKINDIRYINKFFESVNNKLVQSGVFIGSVETFKQRKNRIFKKYHSLLAVPYYAMDFVFKRAFPKFYLTKKLYYSITKGKNRLISLSETLGRLVSCGYEIIGYEEINNLTYFAAKKTGEPAFDKTPSYGLFIQLKRVGKNGKIINVLKFRTMHPFSEYLQEYIYKNNHLNGNGKFNRDFRITTWGNLLRKYWLDELPMLWNLFKGDLKLFGVRPLSTQYYNMYDEDIRLRRIKYKPGLIPPYFADLPKTFEEIMDSERKYLNNYDAHPFKTDWKYFWKVLYNIIFKRVSGG